MLRYTLSSVTFILALLILLSSLAVTLGNGQAPMMALQFEASSNDIVLWDTVQGLTAPISASIQHEFQPTWSPDGRKIAFLRWDRDAVSGTNFIPNLYIMRNNGAGLRQLVNTGDVWVNGSSFLRGGIRWSPDGSKLALYYYVEERVYLHVLTLDGTEMLRRMIRIGEDNLLLWSGDGTQLYRFGRDGGNLRAFALPLTPDADYQLIGVWEDTRSTLARLYPSPLGRDVLLYDPHVGIMDIFDFDAGTRQRLVSYQRLARIAPQWSPDGTAIAYYREDTAQVAIINRNGESLFAAALPTFPDDPLLQIVVSNAPYTVVAEYFTSRCVLRATSTHCTHIFGIRTRYNVMRPH